MNTEAILIIKKDVEEANKIALTDYSTGEPTVIPHKNPMHAMYRFEVKNEHFKDAQRLCKQHDIDWQYVDGDYDSVHHQLVTFNNEQYIFHKSELPERKDSESVQIFKKFGDKFRNDKFEFVKKSDLKFIPH